MISIGPVADGPDEPVRRVAAVQQIVAMHPDKDVGTGAAGERVLRLPACQTIGTVAAIGDEGARRGRSIERVVARAAFEVDLLKGGAAQITDHEPVVAALPVGLERLDEKQVEREGVRPRPREQGVHTGGGESERVAGAVGAVDDGGVDARSADHPVRSVAVVPDQEIVAGAAEQRVVAGSAEQAIVAVLAVQRIRALAAGQGVETGSAEDRVIASGAIDGVVSAESENGLVDVGAEQRIVRVGADPRLSHRRSPGIDMSRRTHLYTHMG